MRSIRVIEPQRPKITEDMAALLATMVELQLHSWEHAHYIEATRSWTGPYELLATSSIEVDPADDDEREHALGVLRGMLETIEGWEFEDDWREI